VVVDQERTGPSARGQLLGAAVDHFGRHGISGVSLRTLAADLGTSHRMLIYHFGSKDGLLVEVVRTVEAQQRAALLELQAGPEADPLSVARLFWRRLTDPALASHERLFFELYGQALQGRPWAVSLLDTVVDSWLESLAALLGGNRPAGAAVADGRLALAVARGLLLDLLTTGDRDGVDAAFERYLQMEFAALAVAPGPRSVPG